MIIYINASRLIRDKLVFNRFNLPVFVIERSYQLSIRETFEWTAKEPVTGKQQVDSAPGVAGFYVAPNGNDNKSWHDRRPVSHVSERARGPCGRPAQAATSLL